MDRSERLVFSAVGIVSLIFVGCGKEAEQSTPVPLNPGVPGQQQPAATPAAAPQPAPVGQQGAVPQPGATPAAPAAPTGVQPSNPMSNLMGALGAIQGQKPGAAPVKTIQWQSLTQALPVAAPGWTQNGTPKGESVQAMGVSVAKASCKLIQGNMTADVEIVDTSMNPMLAVPFNMARSVQVDSSDERHGPINFGAYPGTQRYDKRTQKAEVMVMVKNRVMITVKVKNAPAESAAVGVMQYVNFNHLSSLVDG